MTNLDQLATETANKVAMAPIADIEKSVQVVLSALNKVVKEKDEILKLLTYSYRENSGLKDSIDNALRYGSDIDVAISGGLIKRAAEALKE